MAKKRKSDATCLDEVDRTMYSTFRGAANSLSQLYTQAMNTQRLSFCAGERHSLEKLYQWILRQQEHGARATTIDIITHLQNELEVVPEELHASPVSDFTHSPGRAGHFDNVNRGKSSMFSNAHLSPAQKNLQHIHFAHAVNEPVYEDSMDTNC